jgi:hypothetical protein
VASSSRFFGGELASRERRSVAEILAISSTAARNEASFAFEGLLNPVIFLTNWIEADRISSAVTGGSKLKSGLMFLHMGRLGVQRSAFGVQRAFGVWRLMFSGAAFGVNESTLTESAGHFHGRYDERDLRCLGLSGLDPADTETNTKKSVSSQHFDKIIIITVVMVGIKPPKFDRRRFLPGFRRTLTHSYAS